MSDVRALLKAKRQEARINHPYAAYNSSGQLKCSICGMTVKHPSAWEGHLGSKTHRTNVIRQHQREILEREKFEQDEEKDGNIDHQKEKEQAQTVDSSISFKRKTPHDSLAMEDEHSEKRRKVAKQSLPVDFFSDPSRAPVFSSDDSDDDLTTETAPPQSQPDVPKSTIDLEYELFQRDLTKTTDSLGVYDRATIIAEPVAANAEINKDEQAGPMEEETRQKREQEEKELIMDRLLAEERAQEDADTRVLLLKNKVDSLRKRRQEARVKKLIPKTSS